MVRGFFDNLGHPRVGISIYGCRTRMDVEALIDTGFDGFLCLPVSSAIALGLELQGEITVELADGTLRRELLFRVGVALGKRRVKGVTILTQAEDTLIGGSFLTRYALHIDYRKKTVTIE